MGIAFHTANDISDRTGRVIVITGANSELGFEAAHVLAHKNTTVFLSVRSFGHLYGWIRFDDLQ